MRVCAVSDLHGQLPVIRECDVLVIAGDIAPDFGWDHGVAEVRQLDWFQAEYAAWEQAVPASYIVGTPGNHDWWSKLRPGLRTRIFIDEGWDMDGVKFWFSPWSVPFCGWNYMIDRERRKLQFGLIPHDLDVLVCHTPAHQILDHTYDGDRAGCQELRSILRSRKPKHFCFGHIHEGFRATGMREEVFEQTVCHNCAIYGAGKVPPVYFEV